MAWVVTTYKAEQNKMVDSEIKQNEYLNFYLAWRSEFKFLSCLEVTLSWMVVKRDLLLD